VIGVYGEDGGEWNGGVGGATPTPPPPPTQKNPTHPQPPPKEIRNEGMTCKSRGVGRSLGVVWTETGGGGKGGRERIGQGGNKR